MLTAILPNQDKIKKTLTNRKIQFAALFGSRAKGMAKSNSDYDILIEFLPEAKVGLFEYQDIEEELGSFFGKDVDLVTVGGLDKYLKDEVFKTMKIIYDNRSRKYS